MAQQRETKPESTTNTQTILERVNTPADMKSLSDAELTQLADDVRQHMIQSVSKTGGHLGAGLGVVELTTALHAVFDTPNDRIIWDVGHQTYPHKILTGRKDQMHTIRQGGGLHGFTKRAESKYDPFGAGHSSTSISAGLGMSIARDLSAPSRTENAPDDQAASNTGSTDNKDNTPAPNHVIAVIGDGAMSAGMAYEAMNNAGAQTVNGKKSRLIVILNDNEMSIAPPVGAMSRYLTNLVSGKTYQGAREAGKKLMDLLPGPVRHAAKRAEEGARLALSNAHGGGSFFEEMGFYYIGPVDGHDMDHLLTILRNARDAHNMDGHHGPILIHVKTQKGKGYLPAEASPSKMHGVKTFDVVTGEQAKSAPGAPKYQDVFAQQLIHEADKDDKIVGITAAMPDGTGIDKFAAAHPDRAFDVGIAEQHAVTFAAGLATEGYKPFVAIYSTFLQRAYDQVIHDVAIQNLPVRFMLDRAGLVGADGSTHAGSFDIAYLGCLPNMVLMAAADEAELTHMVATAAAYNDGPIACRYPRGEGTGVDIPAAPDILEIGKGRIIHTSENMKNGAGDIALLSYGTRLEECTKAAQMLEAQGKTVTIADARFAKPLDEALIADLAQTHGTLITIEEGSTGGFGSYVLEFMAREDLLQACRIKTMHLPDTFQDQDKPEKQYEEAGLIAKDIVECLSTK